MAAIELDIGGSGVNVPLLVCFGAFVVTFVTTRTITRTIRAAEGLVPRQRLLVGVGRSLVARTRRYDARFGPAAQWVSDFVAGKPSEPDPVA